MKTKGKKTINDKSGQQRFRVRLLGFVGDQEIGLGDVIKRATSAAGIKSCGGCRRRAETLNRWVRFSPRREQRY